MAKVTYITPGGEEVVVEDAVGNLMEIAREHDVDGIEGACSGCCSCATCHIRVKPEWLDKTGRATEAEQDLIDLESDTDERSRLSCQVEMTDELDGLVVEVAPF
jgi:2Fe-2S ferredoxin